VIVDGVQTALLKSDCCHDKNQIYLMPEPNQIDVRLNMNEDKMDCIKMNGQKTQKSQNTEKDTKFQQNNGS
jgi:hypothetical protein